jgi:uncharacterized membrane-anchored protein
MCCFTCGDGGIPPDTLASGVAYHDASPALDRVTPHVLRPTSNEGDEPAVRSLFRVFNQQPLAAKVPEVTALFWVIKISTTAAGEAISDMFVNNKKLGVVVEVSMFCVALVLQFAVRRYSAVPYWFLALAIATAGTGVADTMHLVFGMPYAITSLFWLVVLAAVFLLWNRSEHTLDIHSITTSRREKYYWCVVFATFALGTAVGDFAASTLGLGYLGSAFFFCGVILVPWAGWRFLNWNGIFSFWFAYVITRPVGASFADYFSKGHDVSGLDLGDWQTALVLTAIVVVLVAYTARARYDIQQPGAQIAGGT